MWALDWLHPGCRPLVLRDADAIGLEHRGVDILPGEMGVGPEHVGADVAPHHEFDHALGHAFLDQMSDPAVPEHMGGDVLADAGFLRDALEPFVDGCMNERLARAFTKTSRLPLGSGL